MSSSEWAPMISEEQLARRRLSGYAHRGARSLRPFLAARSRIERHPCGCRRRRRRSRQSASRSSQLPELRRRCAGSPPTACRRSFTENAAPASGWSWRRLRRVRRCWGHAQTCYFRRRCLRVNRARAAYRRTQDRPGQDDGERRCRPLGSARSGPGLSHLLGHPVFCDLAIPVGAR